MDPRPRSDQHEIASHHPILLSLFLAVYRCTRTLYIPVGPDYHNLQCKHAGAYYYYPNMEKPEKVIIQPTVSTQNTPTLLSVIPTFVLSEHVFQHLSLRDLSSLDRAVTNKAVRNELLTAFEHFTVPYWLSEIAMSPRCFRWVVHRQIKLSAAALNFRGIPLGTSIPPPRNRCALKSMGIIAAVPYLALSVSEVL